MNVEGMHLYQQGALYVRKDEAFRRKQFENEKTKKIKSNNHITQRKQTNKKKKTT